MMPPTVAQAKVEIGQSFDWDFSSYGAYGGYAERGEPGYNIYSGGGFVPRLIGVRGLRYLREMAEEDETVGSMRWTIESTLMKAAWKHVPQVDGKDAYDDAEAVKWADWADSMLVDMRHSFSGHVQSALSMFWAGFAPCEIVLRQRTSITGSRWSDNFWGIGSLPLRDQESVTDWTSDEHGAAKTMKQFGTAGGVAEIPVWKLCNYRTSQELHRPQGRSLLKPAWKPYWLKSRIQDTEAIGIERDLCGMPTVFAPSEDIMLALKTEADGVTPTKEAMAARSRIEGAIKIVSELRFNRKGGIVLPSDVYEDFEGKPSTVRKWDFKIVTTGGQRSIDPRSAARDYDRAIARVVLMQFLHLGDRSGGSYALSENQSGMAIQSLQALADIIVDEWNAKALYLVWLVNAFPAKYRPRMGSPKISENDLNSLGMFFARLGQAALLLEQRPDVTNALFAEAGYGGAPADAPTPEELAARRVAARPPASGIGGGNGAG